MSKKWIVGYEISKIFIMRWKGERKEKIICSIKNKKYFIKIKKYLLKYISKKNTKEKKKRYYKQHKKYKTKKLWQEWKGAGGEGKGMEWEGMEKNNPSPKRKKYSFNK